MYFLFFIFLFFYLHFWVGPSSAQPGHWPKPVTRLGKKTKGTRDLFTRARTLVKVIKLPSHSVLATLNYFFFGNEDAKGTKSYLLLEIEDAAPGDRRCLQR
jgi:hypothetical protein